MRDAKGGSTEYVAPPMDIDIDIVRHVSGDRRRARDDIGARDDGLARRDRRHESGADNGRHGSSSGRYRSHEREPERDREQRRGHGRGRDGASQREGKEGGASRSRNRRDERSRSPTHTRATRDSGRRNGGEHESGVRQLSIRGQSAVAAAAATIDRPESGKARNILDRIRDDRPMSYGGDDYGALRSGERGDVNGRRRGGGGSRRR
ncbi:hypothetical protein GGI13_008361 [Coemansia sp. RSA 455]|nr:hypothetical protein GGI13_008361 [Coemansia sp. RSA 455]